MFLDCIADESIASALFLAVCDVISDNQSLRILAATDVAYVINYNLCDHTYIYIVHCFLIIILYRAQIRLNAVEKIW